MKLLPGWEVGFRLADGLADFEPPCERRGLGEDVLEELDGLWISFSFLTNTPCLSLHLKYFTPFTVPLCLPMYIHNMQRLQSSLLDTAVIY